MEQLRPLTPPDAVVLGASGPLIEWYADRAVRLFPERRDELPKALDGTAWTVIVNFERGQPDYVNPLLDRLRPDDVTRGDLRIVRDDPFQTVLVRSSLLRARLAAEPAPAARAPPAR